MLLLLSSLTLAAPMMLLGVFAIAVPIVIHMLLRPRPRRVSFPPLSFLAQALASGRDAQRVREWRLLALRGSILALGALLLAGPTCSTPTGTAAIREPVACAIVLDDSWSTRYALNAETSIFERERQFCADLLAAGAHWPQPSVVTLLRADASAAPAEWSGDFARLRDRVRSAGTPAPHADTLAAACRAAIAALTIAKQAQRRLVIVSDGAAHAWRDLPGGLASGVNDLLIHVVNACTDNRSNVALIAASAPSTVVPETVEIPLQLSVSPSGIASQFHVVWSTSSGASERAGPYELHSDAATDLTLMLPPLRRGIHAIQVAIEPNDRLEFDQRRYAVVQTAEQPRGLLLVADAESPGRDLATSIFQNLLAPASLPPAAQPIALRVASLDSFSTEPAAEPPYPFIVVMPSGSVPDDTCARLLAAVESGAAMLLACDSRTTGVNWPGLRRVFSPVAPRVESLANASAIRWEARSPFVALAEGASEFARCAVRKRIVLGELADGVMVHARFADGGPAILSKRHGRGEIFLLATSPDPGWSDLGTRAAGLLSFLHAMIDVTLPAPTGIRSTLAHSQPEPPIAAPRDASSLSVSREFGNADGGAQRISITQGIAGELPTASAGVLTLRAGAAAEPLARVAVNWPSEESNLAPISEETLRKLFGSERVSLDTPERTLAVMAPDGAGAMSAGWLPTLSQLLSLGLLALVALELVANARPK